MQITLPEKLLKKIEWDDNTVLDISLSPTNDSIILKKKVEWKVEEAQENIEWIIEDVGKCGTHHLIIANEKKYFITPYNESLHSEIKGIEK